MRQSVFIKKQVIKYQHFLTYHKVQITISLKKLFSHYFFYTDYIGDMAKCNGLHINPKCVCAYEMYTLEISDICKKIAPRNNGSLNHVNGKVTYACN